MLTYFKINDKEIFSTVSENFDDLTDRFLREIKWIKVIKSPVVNDKQMINIIVNTNDKDELGAIYKKIIRRNIGIVDIFVDIENHEKYIF